MNKHRKDHQALHEAYNNIQNQRQIDEKGGFFDRTLAASPIAGMFGGVSDRAKGRVGSRKDLDKLSKMFNREIGSMGKDVDAQQFKGWLSKSTGLTQNQINSIPEYKNLQGRIPTKTLLKGFPKVIDGLRAAKMSGTTATTQPGPQEEEDPNSVFGNKGFNVQAPEPAPAPSASTNAEIDKKEDQIDDIKAQLSDSQPETPQQQQQLQQQIAALTKQIQDMQQKMDSMSAPAEKPTEAPVSNNQSATEQPSAEAGSPPKPMSTGEVDAAVNKGDLPGYNPGDEEDYANAMNMLTDPRNPSRKSETAVEDPPPGDEEQINNLQGNLNKIKDVTGNELPPGGDIEEPAAEEPTTEEPAAEEPAAEEPAAEEPSAPEDPGGSPLERAIRKIAGGDFPESVVQKAIQAAKTAMANGQDIHAAMRDALSGGMQPGVQPDDPGNAPEPESDNVFQQEFDPNADPGDSALPDQAAPVDGDGGKSLVNDPPPGAAPVADGVALSNIMDRLNADPAQMPREQDVQALIDSIDDPEMLKPNPNGIPGEGGFFVTDKHGNTLDIESLMELMESYAKWLQGQLFVESKTQLSEEIIRHRDLYIKLHENYIKLRRHLSNKLTNRPGFAGGNWGSF